MLVFCVILIYLRPLYPFIHGNEHLILNSHTIKLNVNNNDLRKFLRDTRVSSSSDLAVRVDSHDYG